MHTIRYSGANRRSAIDRGDLPVVHAKECGNLKRRRPTTESMEESRQRWDNLADSIRRRSSGRAGSCSTPSIFLSQLKNKKARESKGEGVGAKMTEKRDHRQVGTQLTYADETGRRNRGGEYKQTEPKESALREKERESGARRPSPKTGGATRY